MGCCAALLATRSSVKVQPASVQQTSHAAGGCRQLSLIHAEPPPASSPSHEPHHLPLPTTAASIWSAVESNLKEADDSHCKKKTKTANWDTLYVYIASVYEDFAEERAFLATHVFPELRQWCSAQQLHLVPVDLRQGLTHAPDTVQFAATCLHELDRYMSCSMPVCFIAFISEHLGYTPPPEVLEEPSVLVSRYGWIEGISLLEMEVVWAAFTRHNPNALFFYRDPSFISKLPLDIAVKYMHVQEKDRMETLKAKVQEKYPEQVFQYVVDPSWSNVTGEVTFSGFENMLSKIVVEFFILRMKKELSCCSPNIANSMEQLERLEQEEMERASTANMLGKQALMGTINEYVQGPGSSVPLIVLGETGSGKTALLANVAKFYQDRYSAVKKISQTQQQQTSPLSGQEEGGRKRRFSVADTLQSSLDRGRLRLTETTTLAKKNVRRMSDFVTPSFLHTRSPGHRGRMLRVDDSVLIESEDTSEEGYWSPLPLTSPSLLDGQWLVFYHTVGCIPCSDELHYLLQRLWRIEGLGEPRMVDLPSNPHTLSKVIQEMLATCGGRKFLLIVDSVDRVKGEYPTDIIKWMPVVLPPNVRIILSLQPTSEVRKVLTAQEPPCLELTNGPLGLVHSKLLLKHALQHHSVSPTPALVEVLLNKHGVSNPHYVWELCRVLSIAMETPSLAASGIESAVELAKVLPNELSGLHDHLLRTLEEGQGKVAIAAVCLLQCARHGLGEVELLEMLGTLFGRGEQANAPGEGSSQRLHHPSTDSALVSSRKCSSSDAVSWAGSDAERLSLTESHLSGVGLVKSRQELHLPLRGSNAPSSGNRLSPWYPHRKISGISVTSTPPDWPHSQSPFLMPATPDFTKFGATPSPSSARARHSHHSLSLTPSPHRLSPISGAKPIISPPVDTHQAEELHCGLPPPEIEEVVETKPERLSRPPEVQPPRRANNKLIHLEWGMLLRQLQPFVRNVGKPDRFHWVFSDRAFTRAVAKRYFKNPPTQSFPFAFSSMFCGAKDDHSTLHYMSAKGGGGDLVGVGLPGSGRSNGSSTSDIVQKRYMWWHARLAWYFEACCVDSRRRAEELPYHVMQLQNHGRLSKCLSSLLLLQHLSSPFTEMDLLRYWHCAGGASCAVTAYSQALASLEISGASSQELVAHMKRVALFYHKLGASDSARQLLSDALDVVESRLAGRKEMISDLLYHLVHFLSDTLMEQMGISTPRTLMEPVYRLLKTAGRTVELLRSLDSDTPSERLPAHLLLLCHHLIYYAAQGGSTELTSRSSLEQAQEAAKEAADLFLALHRPAKSLEALLVLSQAQGEDVFQQLDTLRTAEDICRSHFGSLSSTMVTILKEVGELLETKVNNRAAALLYYRQWQHVAVAVYGEEHVQGRAARNRVEETSAQL